MVAYQKFVSLVFEIARERGRKIDSLEDSQKFLNTAAQLWTANKATLRQMTVAQAKDWLQKNA